MNSQDRFYFYHSSIGDLTKRIHKYCEQNILPTPGYITNAFGVKINPNFFPHILSGKEGIEEVPIPANWHADIAEFGSVFRAVDLAKEHFTIIELGCGWGCWLNNAGIVAKRKGLSVSLVGIEGDLGHIVFAKEALCTNGFEETEFKLYHGVASAHAGTALFPIQSQSGVSWGLEPLFNATDEETDNLVKSGSYSCLPQITLQSALPQRINKIDLLHIDIQGGEIELIPESIDFLNEHVATMFIGTHSRQIEGELIDLLINAGWRLEVERPAVLSIGKTVSTLVDGVQFWRNPNLISDKDAGGGHISETNGSLALKSFPKSLSCGEIFEVKIVLKNETDSVWCSYGDNPVLLSYHWLNADGSMNWYDGLRTPLACEIVYADETVEEVVRVQAPDKKGHYQLILTLVQEGVCWFEDRGFTPAIIKVFII
ncbi:MAG: hypothetical protein OEL57_12660 [Trichlorobacter sp.]|uniref:hypothetical protein n=1 Tax=Trichlorobacter sp. TaxID=2911007 RepID=UPI00255F8CF7|nr:hypothetical protein [Trichlorobacter sp.]MDK9718738.1 hypothetical protein [Trichlorobacter sp.]